MFPNKQINVQLLSKGLKPKSYKLKAHQGFTLVETLVAISILLLALTGTIFATTRGIFSAGFARDQVVAFYLVQEATEFVRNVRDNNVIINNDSDPLNDVAFLEGLAPCIDDPDTADDEKCVIDVNAPTPEEQIVTCSGGDCPLLYLNSEGVYNQRGEDDEEDKTIFKRSVTIEEIISNQEALVTVFIKWERRVAPLTITAKANLFNVAR